MDPEAINSFIRTLGDQNDLHDYPMIKLASVSDEELRAIGTICEKFNESGDGRPLFFAPSLNEGGRGVYYLGAVPTFLSQRGGASAAPYSDELRSDLHRALANVCKGREGALHIFRGTFSAFQLHPIYCSSCVARVKEEYADHKSGEAASSKVTSAVAFWRRKKLGDFLFAVTEFKDAAWWLHKEASDVASECGKGMALVVPEHPSPLLVLSEPSADLVVAAIATAEDSEAQRKALFPPSVRELKDGEYWLTLESSNGLTVSSACEAKLLADPAVRCRVKDREDRRLQLVIRKAMGPPPVVLSRLSGLASPFGVSIRFPQFSESGRAFLQCRVPGMSCDGCARTLKEKLEKQHGVLAVVVTQPAAAAMVAYRPTDTDASQILRFIQLNYPEASSEAEIPGLPIVGIAQLDNWAGLMKAAAQRCENTRCKCVVCFCNPCHCGNAPSSAQSADDASENGAAANDSDLSNAPLLTHGQPLLQRQRSWFVSGMSCSSCARRIEDALRAQAGVIAATVSFPAKKMTVQFDESAISVDGVMSVVGGLGYTTSLSPPASGSTANSPTSRAPNSQNFPVTKPRSAGLPTRTSAKVVIQPVSKPFKFVVEGMTCASCAARIEKALSKLPEVDSVSVNFALGNAVVHTSSLNPQQFEKVIEGLGYSASFQREVDVAADTKATRHALERTEEISSLTRRFTLSLLFSLPLFLLMTIGDYVGGPPLKVLGEATVGDLLGFFLSTPVVFIFGRHFFVRAAIAARNYSASMDTLVAVGVGSAWLFSFVSLTLAFDGCEGLKYYFDAAGELITFMLLGKLLEAKAKRGTSGALLQLMSLAPSKALLVTSAGDVEVEAATLQVTDVFRVRSGDRIPVDGVIESGAAAIDEQLITGESVPIDKKPGDGVIAGTLCVDSDIVVRATKVGSETTLARILKVVQDAQTTKPAIQRLADKVAAVFVPVILSYAAVIFVLWLLASNFDWYPQPWRGTQSGFIFAFQFFLASVVVACPCAMGLAVPTAIMVGTGIAANNGVLIKDGPTMEKMNGIQVVLFDKTGTLTTGIMDVTATDFGPPLTEPGIESITNAEWRSIIGTVESRSNHPIGVALKQAYGVLPASSVVELTVTVKGGSGLEARLLYRRAGPGGATQQPVSLYIVVGKPSMMADCGVSVSRTLENKIQDAQNNGCTVVVAAVNGTALLAASLADQPKPQAWAAVKALGERGMTVYMVSGDHRLAADRIARLVGIASSHVHAEVLPWNKAEVVKTLQERGHRVCFVGDGLNDSPALTQADVGVALGAGTEVAVDSADAVLMKNSLQDLVTLFDLSRVVIRRVYFNFFWAFIYNIVALPLASGLLFIIVQQQIPPVAAAIAMISSSLTVLSSSLALRLYRPPKLLGPLSR